MSRRPIKEDVPFQAARCRKLMQQADAEWEEITHSLQRQQEHLADLQQRLAHFRLALTVLGDQRVGPTPALTTQIIALERQIAQLEQQMSLENACRSAVTRQFEQARLVLASLRRPPLQPWQARIRKFLNGWLKRPLRVFWVALQQSCEWSEIIPTDESLKNHP